MGKIIAGMNMTLDGFCDHTSGIADEEVHQHYSEVLREAGMLLYGRITYQLMEDYWPALVQNPSGNAAMDEFAVAIDDVPKIVFSRTLQSVDWRNTELKKEIVPEEILALKQRTDKDIFAGSPSMIVTLTQLGLVDEYQIGLNPIIAGSGLTLFKNIQERIDLQLMKTKTFGCGVIMLYYSTNK